MSDTDDGVKASDSLSNSYLGRLPQELRDEVYKHYFTTRGGYLIDPTTNTLRAVDGKPINLSLRLTCHAIAKETEGLALQYNTIHATTTEEKRFIWAAYHSLRVTKGDSFDDHRALVQLSRCITPGVADEILEGFPQYRDALQELIANRNREGPGRKYMRCTPPTATEAWSTEQRFVSRAVKIMDERLDIPGSLYSALSRLHLLSLLNTGPEQQAPCWEFQRKTNPFEIVFSRIDGRPVMGEDKPSSCFSAAAVAIRFWNALDPTTRMQIRRFDIDEDRRSRFFPMCHTEGFIPLWQENPKLRINRRVNLVNTIVEEARQPDRSAWHREHAHHADKLKTLWDWIAEVKALHAAFVIPKGAFSLKFYSDASPEDTKEVVDVMQEAAAWQMALDKVAQNGNAGNTHALGFNYSDYLWDPRGLAWHELQEISKGSSIIKCDFDMGQSVDPKDLYDGSGRWSHERWNSHCAMNDSNSWRATW
ncbi:hypothetical protein J4E93_010738 [Alternaria ventricosa]|uniref:uncharacterized protein n=1 Tax=Alternaria ventricosa TaxID=1187951 RepID=UPI0020C2812C|nr:uncharacterized protein J4E93_010738 [Alternaria ventricosa]KAI4636948.1 hypothetical protein J4E93_010738 [Alternaria ventricosa]